MDASSVISPNVNAGDSTSKGGVTWDATISGSQVPISCAAEVSAVTHVNTDLKSEVLADLSMDQAGVLLDLEITVMVPGMTYYYTKYPLQFELPNNDPTPTPSVSPTTETPPPSVAPVTSAPAVVSSNPSSSPSTTFHPSASGCRSSDPMYECSVELDDDLVFFYNFTTAESTMLSARFHYTGEGYIGWGVSKSGNMVPSDAVIGLPGQAENAAEKFFNPGKYDMTRYSKSGVNLMDADQQTLIDASVAQDDSGTTLTFTKLLNEPGELEISPTDANTFIWARGGGNALSLHSRQGSFVINLSSATGGSVEILDVTSDTQDLWLLHGWLMALAWCVTIPLAIASSLLRDFLPADSKVFSWFVIHRGMNSLGSLLAIGGLALAIHLTEEDYLVHFDGTHQILGICVMSFMMLQVAGGVFRPAAALKDAGDGEVAQVSKSTLRVRWEFVHKRFGYVLVLFAAFVVLSGVFAYHDRYEEYDAMSIFVFGMVVLVAEVLVTLYIRWKGGNSKDSSDDDVNVQEVVEEEQVS